MIFDFLLREIRSTGNSGPMKGSSGSMTGYGSLTNEFMNRNEKTPMNWPKKLNMYGKILILMYIVIFNLVFWCLCLNEYLQPAEKYIMQGGM